MKRICVVWILMMSCIHFSNAQKPSVVTSNEDGWQKIGEISASFKTQSESIIVMGADQFNELRLKVTDAPINIERLQVFYESGKMEEFDVNNQLQEGAQTRSVAINGNEDIQKVAFTYKTLPNYRGERAHVELYGFKSGQERNSYRDEARDVKEDADRAAENTERDLEEGADEAGNKTERALEKTGDKISEAAAKAEAEITDQTFEGKVAPGGQKVFIDKYDKYYYINEEGNKIYISKSEMKDNPEDNK